MRTNINIDDELMRAAMDLTGHKTKRETVETALRMFVDVRRSQREMLPLEGKIQWEGDLDQMRRGG